MTSKSRNPWDEFQPPIGAPHIESWTVRGETWTVRLRGCNGDIVTDDVGQINSLKRFRDLAANQLGKFFPAMKQSEWALHLVDQQSILKREKENKRGEQT